MISEEMSSREDGILTKNNMVIKMNPRIARIFERSINVLNMNNTVTFELIEKGKSHILLYKALLNFMKKAKE